MLVSVLAATVGRGTPADKRMVMYVCLKLYQATYLPECVKYLPYEGAFESMNRRYEASGICVKNLSLNGAIKN